MQTAVTLPATTPTLIPVLFRTHFLCGRKDAPKTMSIYIVIGIVPLKKGSNPILHGWNKFQRIRTARYLYKKLQGAEVQNEKSDRVVFVQSWLTLFYENLYADRPSNISRFPKPWSLLLDMSLSGSGAVATHPINAERRGRARLYSRGWVKVLCSNPTDCFYWIELGEPHALRREQRTIRRTDQNRSG